MFLLHFPVFRIQSSFFFIQDGFRVFFPKSQSLLNDLPLHLAQVSVSRQSSTEQVYQHSLETKHVVSLPLNTDVYSYSSHEASQVNTQPHVYKGQVCQCRSHTLLVHFYVVRNNRIMT